MLQRAIVELQKLGPLPDSDEANPDDLDAWYEQSEKVRRPISDDDAKILITLFGPDDCYGLMWTLIHIIETAPGWPMLDLLKNYEGLPFDIMKERCRNSGYRI